MINVKILNFHRAAIRGFFTMQISFKRLTFACLVFLLLLHNATTWGQSDHTKRLIEGAKKEGETRLVYGFVHTGCRGAH